MATIEEAQVPETDPLRIITHIYKDTVKYVHPRGSYDDETTWIVKEQRVLGETCCTFDPAYVVFLGINRMCEDLGGEQALCEALVQQPEALCNLFRPLIEDLPNMPKHGTRSALMAHMWVILLVRKLGTARFLAADIGFNTGSVADEYLLRLDNWLSLLCHAGMHQTLEQLYRLDRETLQRTWCTTVLSDLHGGPVGRACSSALGTVDNERSRLTYDVVHRAIVDCPPELRAEGLRSVDTRVILAQNGGMALVQLAATLENPMTTERVLRRIMDWCPDVLMNVVDRDGYTALARVVERGGRPSLATTLVSKGASLLVTVPNESAVLSAQNTPADAPAELKELLKRERDREYLLMAWLVKDHKCKHAVRTRRIAAYRAAWNERQRQLKARLSSIVRENLEHEPLKPDVTRPQLRVHATFLAVTPREADCTYSIVSAGENGQQEESSVPQLTREQHERQRQRIVLNAELKGRYSGRVYDQYEMEPHENHWVMCPPQIQPVVPGMMLKLQITMQNGAAIDCAVPSTVMITLVGSGDMLDPYLPGFSPVTVVFHTKNYLTYCGLDDSLQDEVDQEAQRIAGGLGHEMYRLGKSASMFCPERAAAGAAAMPFHMLGAEASERLSNEASKSIIAEQNDSSLRSIDPRNFIETIHWEKEPEPAHLVVAHMNVATCVAPIQVMDDKTLSSQSNGGEQPAEPQQPVNMALKFQTLIFDFIIISRNASDIMLKQHQLQEDYRLEELGRQERLEQQRKYAVETLPNTAPEKHSVQTDKGTLEFQV